MRSPHSVKVESVHDLDTCASTPWRCSLRASARTRRQQADRDVPRGTVRSWLHTDRERRGDAPGADRTALGATAEAARRSCRVLPICWASISATATSVLAKRGCLLPPRSPAPTRGPASSTPAKRPFSVRVPANNGLPSAESGLPVRPRSISKHWPCLFPQHGPGQEARARDHARSHGNRRSSTPTLGSSSGVSSTPTAAGSSNWTTRLVRGEQKRYEYPRYFFTNKSDDIRQAVHRHARPRSASSGQSSPGQRPVQHLRRPQASVALMDTHVGPKH